MKVLLINPPMENMIMSDSPLFVDEERGYNPPLGLLYLASYIIKNGKHEVKILDTQVEELAYSEIRKRISIINPDIVGIQAMTFTLIDSIKVAKIVKHINPKIKVVMGGPHVNIFPDETISIPFVDLLILGEGEHVFSKFLDYINNQSELKKIRGVVFKTETGKIVKTGNPSLIQNLDELPFPARNLTPYKKYFSLLAKHNPITTMFTSRGCPYQCAYCDRPHLGKVFRARTATNVVDEMEECVNMGIKEILIYDDTFTIDRNRVVNICNEIIKRKLDVTWDIRARVNTIDKMLLHHLKRAGCTRIHYGVEASDQRILNNLRKGITLKQVKNAFLWTKQEGIESLAYFMIGSPGEGKEEILKTIEFAKHLDPDFVSFSVTTPFPATDLYKWALERGVIKRDVWREFAKNPTKRFKAPLWTEKLTRDELLDLLNHCYKSFYKRPRYFIRKLLDVKSTTELMRKIKAGIRIMEIK